MNSQISFSTEVGKLSAEELCTKVAAPTKQPSRPAAVDAAFFIATADDRWVRLPSPGERCEWSGLSRTGINALTLASKENNFRPPVLSSSFRKKGQTKATRLVNLGSLLTFIREQAKKTMAENAAAAAAASKPSKKKENSK